MSNSKSLVSERLKSKSPSESEPKVATMAPLSEHLVQFVLRAVKRGLNAGAGMVQGLQDLPGVHEFTGVLLILLWVATGLEPRPLRVQRFRVFCSGFRDYMFCGMSSESPYFGEPKL